VAPSELRLEATEAALVEAPPSVVAELYRLHAVGVGFAVDNFGTRETTLSHLRRFHLGAVKLDRSVVAGLGVSRRAAAIVEAVTEACNTLGLMAIAQGVETQDQLDTLRALGCPRAQGFFLGARLPADEFPFLLASHVGRVAAAS
jgi:EAL domain-containing protein (putative c-di-GMP-specific phosphodiesterase class I)